MPSSLKFGCLITVSAVGVLQIQGETAQSLTQISIVTNSPCSAEDLWDYSTRFLLYKVRWLALSYLSFQLLIAGHNAISSMYWETILFQAFFQFTHHMEKEVRADNILIFAGTALHLQLYYSKDYF